MSETLDWSPLPPEPGLDAIEELVLPAQGREPSLLTLLGEWCELGDPELVPDAVLEGTPSSSVPAASSPGARKDFQPPGIQAFGQPSTSSPGVPEAPLSPQPAGLTGLVRQSRTSAAATPCAPRRRPGRPRRPSLAAYQVDMQQQSLRVLVQQRVKYESPTVGPTARPMQRVSGRHVTMVCLQQGVQKQEIQQLTAQVAGLEAELRHAVLTPPQPLDPSLLPNPRSQVSWVQRPSADLCDLLPQP